MKKYVSSLPKKIKWSLLIISMILILGIIGYITILYGGKLVIEEDKLILDVTTTIETTDGKVIGSLYHENRKPVTLGQVPEHVIDAFIAIEDKRFYKHAGIDIKSVGRAVYRDIIALGKVEGASTITQQLAKNLFLENDKTWMRKTKEVMAALYLEREFSKDDILELYLNAIYFGDGVYGIETASQYFFSKSVQDLSIAEGALIAGLAKAPNGYSPINNPDKSITRRNLVLKVMNDANMLSTEVRLIEEGKTLGLDVQEKEVNPWVDGYIDLVMKEAAKNYQLSMNELKRGGYRVIVQIDEKAQEIAYKEFMKDDYFPGSTDGVEGAFVMLDQENGAIKVAIGGRDYQQGDLNRVTVKRQPGSVIKPLAVFAPAMMEEYQPYTLIRDEEMDHNGYVATNYDGEYDGVVSIYDALAESKNAPAVWLLDQIGIDYAKDYLKKMYMDIPDDGLAIALGGLSEGLTPLNMVEGYRTFAHEGKSTQAYTIDRIYNQKSELIAKAKLVNTEVFSPQVAWNMTEILMNTVEAGTAKAGEYSKSLAGKTGSTEHPHVKGMVKDAWFVGYTPQYVSALWMGYDRSDKDHYLMEGSSFPTKLTKEILTEIDKQEPLVADFKKPNNVKAVPKPIELPKIVDMNVKYVFGGFSLVQGKITWSGSDDDRVVYRIYLEKAGIDQRIGEVVGQTEFVIKDVALLQSNHYYVVPYNPLTKIEGEQSKSVKLPM